MPVSIIMATLMHVIVFSPSMEKEAVANMICIAFFYCMRPGEYIGTTTDDQAFALEDITLYIGARRLTCVWVTSYWIFFNSHLFLRFWQALSRSQLVFKYDFRKLIHV